MKTGDGGPAAGSGQHMRSWRRVQCSGFTHNALSHQWTKFYSLSARLEFQLFFYVAYLPSSPSEEGSFPVLGHKTTHWFDSSKNKDEKRDGQISYLVLTTHSSVQLPS